MTDQNDNRLGRAVASRRGALGLKRKDLAERAHLSYPYISEIENGLKEPSAKAQRQIAEALDLSVAELAALTEEVGANLGMSPAPPVATRATHLSEATFSRGRPTRPSPVEEARGARDLGYAAPAASIGSPDVVRDVVREELERFATDELPSLIQAEIRRVLADRAEEDLS